MVALLARVIEDPDSDEARLAWADAIDDADRAALVRTQIARRNAPDDVTLIHRERDLLLNNAARWHRDLRPHAIGVSFRRGFPEWVAVKMKPVVDDPAGLFAKTPVTHLATRSFSKALAHSTRDAAHWKNLRSATFPECKLDASALGTFLRAPALGSLRALTVPYNSLGADTIPMLLDTPAAERLEWLDLSANRLFDNQLAPLLSASKLTRLRHLGLGGGVLAALDGMVVLTNALALPNLESLVLASNRLLGEDLRPLEHAKSLARLRRLDVTQNEIGGMGALVLARGPWRDLVELRIGGDTAPEPGFASLAGDWRRLEKLVYFARDRSSTTRWRRSPPLRCRRSAISGWVQSPRMRRARSIRSRPVFARSASIRPEPTRSSAICWRSPGQSSAFSSSRCRS